MMVSSVKSMKGCAQKSHQAQGIPFRAPKPSAFYNGFQFVKGSCCDHAKYFLWKNGSNKCTHGLPSLGSQTPFSGETLQPQGSGSPELLLGRNFLLVAEHSGQNCDICFFRHELPRESWPTAEAGLLSRFKFTNT